MLRDAEYQTLVEQAPMIIWRADPSGRCDYFNERWLAFTGRTMAQEVGDGWAEGVHADDLKRCLEIYLGCFARREPFAMEYRLRRHDGVYRWILDCGAPSHGAQGEFLGYIGSCIDVTERVQAREALERQHREEVERLRSLIPVCFGCKSVRDEKGAWSAVDAYLARSQGRTVTHGLCSDCFERLYPEGPRD